MKNERTLLLFLAAAGAAFATLYIIRKKNERKMLASIAEEGYETAPDILFPRKRTNDKLHYGPVIPK